MPELIVAHYVRKAVNKDLHTILEHFCVDKVGVKGLVYLIL
jgi:hypothetical protein